MKIYIALTVVANYLKHTCFLLIVIYWKVEKEINGDNSDNKYDNKNNSDEYVKK